MSPGRPPPPGADAVPPEVPPPLRGIRFSAVETASLATCNARFSALPLSKFALAIGCVLYTRKYSPALKIFGALEGISA